MGKINKKNLTINQKTKCENFKELGNAKNILPMKLKESPKQLTKKTPKKIHMNMNKSLNKIVNQNLTHKDTTKIKNKSKKVENINKSKIDSCKMEENFTKNERTIFIGNLPSNIKKNQLQSLLVPYGRIIKCRFRLPTLGKPILKHKMAVKAGGLNAYAELSNIDEAKNALKLNGTEYKNHRLRVTKSDETHEVSKEHEKYTIFLGNLKYSANDDTLYNIFSSCGEIEYCRTLNNAKGCRGVAYICFKNSHSVGLALELNGTLLEDRPIRVSKYSSNIIKENEKKGKKEEPQMNGFMRRVMKKFMKDEKVDRNITLDKSNVYKKKKNLKDTGRSSKLLNKNKNKIDFRGVEVKSKKKFKSKGKGCKMLKDLANKIAPK